MAEFQHDPVLGSWFFQVTPTASVLDRMTKNARAAHWNKPRAVRYRDTADFTTTQTIDEENTHQVMISGVRVIRGPAQNLYPSTVEPADVNPQFYYGDPQVMFPIGPGVSPFVRRPVIMSHAIAMEIEKTAPLEGTGLFSLSSPQPLEDYSFLNWFGGIDWGAASGTSPDGIDYDVNQFEAEDEWPRACIARPIGTTQTGQPGAYDLTIGARFRIIFGRLGGTFNHPGVGLAGTTPVPRGYYIHYQAMGPVAAY